MVLRSWGASVVTEWTPVHQAREKSHGRLITYRLVVMFTAADSLHTSEEKSPDGSQNTRGHLSYEDTHTHTHTHTPGELSGHGAVVQVEFDDVVVLELL